MNKEEAKRPLILLVDDTPKNIQLLGKMLSQEGFEISVATSGQQALTIIDNRPPDLILLDIMMPEIGGFEVCKKIKSNKKNKNIPVIFISALQDMENKLKGFEVGGADYITKPFHSTEVIARVQTHLRLKKAMEVINNYNTQLEYMLEERTKELIKTERHAAFSLLIQGIVHNLKNPLTGVFGGAQMILLYKEDIEKLGDKVPENLRKIFSQTWKYAQTIYSSSEKLVRMINSLMAKSKSDKTEEIEIVNLNELICQEINFLEADQRFKHYIKNTINLANEELRLEISPSELSQVFQNLIRNSIDAMHNQRDAKIIIETGRKNQKVWFSIEDNGPGIPEHIQSKIFDPFFSTKPKTTAAGNDEPVGTGLGLHTCSQMVESYKGSIELDSKEGVGTKFKIYFPATEKL